MSYILDALRKSERERRQGRVPDLGHQVQFVHKPGRKRGSAARWIAIGLVLNAAVIGLALWFWLSDRAATTVAVPSGQASDVEQMEQVEQGGTVGGREPEPVVAAPEPGELRDARERAPDPVPVADPVAASGPPVQELPVIIRPGQAPEPYVVNEPTLIVPGKSPEPVSSGGDPKDPADLPARVPHLVELPLSFQKSVPNLTFNSHVYSSQASSSRVMINGHYLQTGQSFSGIRVEKITEDGVVLSKDGRVFRVGVVRDWVSPR
ncbi:MAG: general secretion pathway protein GspB [Pseudomonadota bacterium]|nr:general secretion pathway protein GspB [Pseudomonadota bacterium]